MGDSSSQTLLISSENHIVHFRDPATGTSLRSVSVHAAPASCPVRQVSVGIRSGRLLLTLVGPGQMQISDCVTGATLHMPSLGEDLATSYVLACALAPDDSAIVALIANRHQATSLYILDVDDHAAEEETRL